MFILEIMNNIMFISKTVQTVNANLGCNTVIQNQFLFVHHACSIFSCSAVFAFPNYFLLCTKT